MEIAVDDQHYEVVIFDKGKCMSHPLTSTASFVAHMSAHLTFWIKLVKQIQRCADVFGDIESVACAIIRQRELAEIIDELLEGDLNFVKEPIEAFTEATLTSGRLHLAHKHLRLKQLLQITNAVDALVLNDPITALAALEITTEKARARCTTIIRAFKESVVPRVVAGLWAWKTYERVKSSSEINNEEVKILWLAIMKVRTLAMLDNDDNRLTNTTLNDASCVLRKFPISKALRVGDFTLRDIWSVLKRLSWDWPLITPGPVTRRLIDAMWWRCAFVSIQAMAGSVANHPILVKRIEDGAMRGNKSTIPLFRVSDHFVAETERLFNNMCDTLWTLNWFEARRIATENVVSQPLVEQSHAAWVAYVRHALTGQLSDFVKREFSKRIWVYNARRDEIESYNIDTRTTQGNHVKSILMYHRPDYDTILTVSNSLPSSIIQPACDTTSKNLNAAVNWHRQNHPTATESAAGIVEWQWPSVWELIATHDRGQDGAIATTSFETFNVKISETGEKIFTDKATNRRLRGEQAMAAAALFSTATIQASKNEFDAIVESVLLVKMQATSKGNNPMLHVNSDLGEFISLATLPNIHPVLSLASRTKPTIMRIGGYYIVYDGYNVLAQHPLLSYILAVWCREVDILIEKQLLKLGALSEVLCANLAGKTSIGVVSREDTIKMINKAVSIAEDVPQELRKLFGVTRHPKTAERVGGYRETLIVVDNRAAPPTWIGSLLRKMLDVHRLVSDGSDSANDKQATQPGSNTEQSSRQPGIAWV